MDVEDEKKPFDAETAPEDDAQPDPDEQLMLDQGNGRIWLVKVPKFLMERWAAVAQEDVHLATLRVYPATTERKERIVLFLPPNIDPSSPSAPLPAPLPGRPVFDTATAYPSTGAEPDAYELDMVNDAVENQIVVAERPKDASLSTGASAAAATASTRARTTILTGRIKHEASLRPAFSARYRRQVKERHRKYTTPARTIRMMDTADVPGGKGGINRLTSGVGVGAGNAFGDFIKTKPKPAKGTFERMARIPRNQLLDQLFALFRQTPRWGIKPLRDRTQQPEVYLKEVLSEIAFLHKAGEWNGLWELQEAFRDGSMKAENVPGPSTPADYKMEDEDEFGDDDEEDEDEDMEEVS
ncbi:transcription initiation factor IIF, beta subunit [Pholiota molesta]|nr:transcription initiation factor IIF, beta subunit [Pholiota molesta]